MRMKMQAAIMQWQFISFEECDDDKLKDCNKSDELTEVIMELNSLSAMDSRDHPLKN